MELTYSQDTIVAAATARGRAGVGIVRVSGPDVKNIAARVLPQLPLPRQATLLVFSDENGEALDQGLAIFFPGPNSYTGEDVLELHGHGGPVVIDRLIQTICRCGARLAGHGEFSARAFFNDKLDLAQAEAVADLIDSGSVAAARAALRSLSGEFSAATQALTTAVTELRMYVEAAIDFPEEEIDFLDDEALHRRIDATRSRFESLEKQTQQGRALNDGLTVVLAGAPNVGKSSLLNRLVGHDAAIVTEVAGTTRDLIRDTAIIDGLVVEFVDTAGLRVTDDVVEQEGIRRSHDAARTADHALLLVDASDVDASGAAMDLIRMLPDGLAATLLLNKTDIVDHPLDSEVSRLTELSGYEVMRLSAKTGDGLDALRDRLKSIAGLSQDHEGSFSARRRHVVALAEARAAFERGVSQLLEYRAGELMAEELRLCQESLAAITGTFTSDDLLGKIFGEFCIGK